VQFNIFEPIVPEPNPHPNEKILLPIAIEEDENEFIPSAEKWQ
jgi:hypothetical protein